jgi:single-strand DNA-binding protein
MASFNKVLLLGNLTRDPELRYTASGAAVASFGLAVNRRYKQGEQWKDEVCFVDVTVWAKQGENCAEWLNYQTWESDGQKRSKLEVVANNVQFLSRPGGKGEGEGRPMEMGGDKDDIPF